MPIRFACPHCGRVSRADDNWAGRKARCPGCQQLIQVPASSNVADDAAPPPVSDPSKTVVETTAATTQTISKAVPPAAPQPPTGAPKPADTGPQPARPQRPKIALSPHPEERSKSTAKPQLRPRSATPSPQTVSTTADRKREPEPEKEQPQKPKPKPVPAAARTDNRPPWMQAKRVGIAAVALSTLGFLMFWLPYVGLGLSVLGVLAGVASIGLSLFDRGVGLGYGLAGICIGMVGFVPGLVRTRQSMVTQAPLPIIRQVCSYHRGPYPHAASQTCATTLADVA